jgi:outer membrane protein assembly factor BamB
LIVHIGCGNGEVTAALGANDSCVVHGLSREAQHIESARRYISSLGLYGSVSVELLSGGRLPYSDNLVNLIVTEGPPGVSEEEIWRVLAPNGVLLETHGDGWKKTVKPWPDDIDEWTHWLHDASGNAVAKDRRVGPPRRVQWVERPLWQRHHDLMATIPAMVSAGGRVFYICDEAPSTAVGLPDQWKVIARDAFNGTRLWSYPMGKWGWKYWHTSETAGGRWGLPFHVRRRLVADGRRVYVTLDFNGPLTALNSATGAVIKTYEGTEFTDEILLHNGVLLLSVSKSPQEPGRIAGVDAAKRPGETPRGPAAKKEVVALDAESGDVLWRQGDYLGIATKEDILERFTYLCLAANSEQVFLVEEDALISLDLKTGREMWRWPRPPRTTKRGYRPYKPGNMCTLLATDDVVVYAQPEEGYETKNWNRSVNSRLMGVCAKTGKTLWSQESGYWATYGPPDVFVIDGLVWTHAAGGFDLIGVDLASGEIKRRFSAQSVLDEVHHHRCYRNKATERYLLTARRGIEFLDLETERRQAHHWVRGGCRYGVMPCNGLVYAPPHPCQCYIAEKLSGFFALASESRKDGERRAELEEPRAARTADRGPAYGRIGNRQSVIANPNDWPTYRHDVHRSGGTKSNGPAELELHWRTHVGGAPSACTIAGGMVFLAVVDKHRVCALEADSGRPVWSFTAGGRVDTPPTIHGGMALFGSADGWVYAVRAADGELVWRFRAAPHDRRIMAFGQLESPWPLHGAVLVKDGLAYVAAGRSTHLDGGVHVLALKPESGELVGELRPANSDARGLADVLVSDGDLVYMRHLAFAPPGRAPPVQGNRGQAAKAARHVYSTAGLLDGSYFSRVGWTTKTGMHSEPLGWKSHSRGQSDLLVFHDEFNYGFRSKRQGGYGGWFRPGTGAYRITCTRQGVSKARWSVPAPVRVRAMVATSEALFVAGSPDVVDPDDPWAAFEGRAGGTILAMSLTDGRKRAERELAAAPVFDGMSAAHGSLFISATDGHVVCLADP